VIQVHLGPLEPGGRPEAVLLLPRHSPGVLFCGSEAQAGEKASGSAEDLEGSKEYGEAVSKERWRGCPGITRGVFAVSRELLDPEFDLKP